MLDILLETLIETIKMLPFLFLAYLLIEYIEHKSGKNLELRLKKLGKYSSIGGAVLGAVPQCGFSVATANLYSARVISVGTMIAVFISTSDEMIPVLLANSKNLYLILVIVAIKIVFAIIAGVIADLIFKKHSNVHSDHHEICEKCGCEHSILKASIKHTVEIFFFILIISCVMHLVIHYIGEDAISKILMTNSIIQPFIASLFGFIPSCATSVVLTELFLNGSLNFGSMIAGLCTSAGLGLVVLFKTNKDYKMNFKIMLFMYLISSLFGVIVNLF